MSNLHGLALAAIASLVAGCVIPVPIPARDESVVYGRAFGDDEVRVMMSGAETADTMTAKLGAPMVDFGPRRVFVYGWTVEKGSIAGAMGAGDSGGFRVTPWLEAHLLIVAFDHDGRVLKSGTVEYSPLQSMSGQVRRWLSSNGLAAQVSSPRIDVTAQSGGMLFVYRPSSSACSFPLFDSSIFRLKITVDGQTVGDLPKGAYLASEIGANNHAIVIQSYSDFFRAGSEGVNTSFAAVNTMVESDHDIYVEAYLCTGGGDVQTHAAVRNAEAALKAMRDLQPAW